MINSWEEHNSIYLRRVFGGRTGEAPFMDLVHGAHRAALLLHAASPFDAIAFRGMSGAAVGFPLGMLLDCPMLMVRKQDGSHSRRKVEGAVSREIKRYAIIDDFCDTGKTLNQIVMRVTEAFKARLWRPPVCAGAVFYHAGIRTEEQATAMLKAPVITLDPHDGRRYEPNPIAWPNRADQSAAQDPIPF